MSEQSQLPEQRAFSPKEVSTILGVDRSTILSLVNRGELGSTKVGGSRRIFVSDLESYLGEDRARSLVRDLGDGPQGHGEKRMSQFEAVAEVYSELSEDEAIVLKGLSESDLRSIRRLLYHQFKRKNVVIRSARQDDDTLMAIVYIPENSKCSQPDYPRSDHSQVAAKMKVT